MRLKVSPKVAIEKIDALVREGAEMVDWFVQTYEVIEKAAEEEKIEKKAAKEAKIRAQYSYDPWQLTVGQVRANEMLAMQMNDYMFTETEAAEEGLKQLKDKFDDWLTRTCDDLKEIYVDFTPVFAFINATGEHYYKPLADHLFSEYINMKREIEAKVDTLIGFYEKLVDNIRSPLAYLPNEAKLCFYDFVCPLKADSNEASLCAFMFEHSIGEKVEMIDAYSHMFGEQRTTLGAAEKDKIKNAVDGINRKTNKAFGFPIIAKDTTTINLTIPARVTQSLL